jgi:hypothetical protein
MNAFPQSKRKSSEFGEILTRVIKNDVINPTALPIKILPTQALKLANIFCKTKSEKIDIGMLLIMINLIQVTKNPSKNPKLIISIMKEREIDIKATIKIEKSNFLEIFTQSFIQN